MVGWSSGDGRGLLWLWPVFPGGKEETFGPAALPIAEREGDRVANGLTQPQIDLLGPAGRVLANTWEALQDKGAPRLFAAHDPLRDEAAVERDAGKINLLDRLQVIVDRQQIRLRVEGQPDTLGLATPGHGPGNIAHGEFVFSCPTDGVLDGGWIVGRVSDGNGFGRQERKNHRQAGDGAKERQDEVTQFAQGQLELVEQ